MDEAIGRLCLLLLLGAALFLGVGTGAATFSPSPFEAEESWVDELPARSRQPLPPRALPAPEPEELGGSPIPDFVNGRSVLRLLPEPRPVVGPGFPIPLRR